MADDLLVLEAGGRRAAIAPLGAQLKSFRDVDGTELLWQGAPGYWPETAPILFPIIAGIPDDAVTIAGTRYPMPAHGFALTKRFEPVARGTDHLVLTLADDDETRAHYPFAFRLTVSFALSPERLDVIIGVENRDRTALPGDVGFHPGFRWPLEDELGKDAYALTFERPEPAPIRRGTGDPIVLLPDPRPTPVEDRVLKPTDELFEAQAVVFDRFESRSIVFGAPGHRGIQLDFPDSPNFALWMQPGARFLCLEPWQGYPAPVDFAGELADKPGTAIVPPGERRTWRHAITPLATTPPAGTMPGASSS